MKAKPAENLCECYETSGLLPDGVMSLLRGNALSYFMTLHAKRLIGKKHAEPLRLTAC